MISLDFLSSIIIVWLTSFILIILGLKILFKKGFMYKKIGIGLFSIAMALILNGIFDLFFIFKTSYWIIVEIFHIFGVLLITWGILSKGKKKMSKENHKNSNKYRIN